jgi:hypothetical protein
MDRNYLNRIFQRNPMKIQELQSLESNDYHSIEVLRETELSVRNARVKLMKKFKDGVVLNRREHIEYILDHLRGLSQSLQGMDHSRSWV